MPLHPPTLPVNRDENITTEIDDYRRTAVILAFNDRDGYATHDAYIRRDTHLTRPGPGNIHVDHVTQTLITAGTEYPIAPNARHTWSVSKHGWTHDDSIAGRWLVIISIPLDMPNHGPFIPIP